MPFKAKIKGKNVTFKSHNLKEKHRNKYEFLCPNCEKQLIPVIPNNNIVKHFRHKSECDYKSTDPETAEHFQMKHDIRNNLIRDNKLDFCETEYVIGDKQTDIGLSKNREKIAVECQYSNITLNEFRKRNKKYNENNYSVLWIFYQHPMDYNAQEVKVKKVKRVAHHLYFQRLFCYHPDSGLYVVKLKSVYRERKKPIWEVNEYSNAKYIDGWEYYDEKLKTIKYPFGKEVISFQIDTFENKKKNLKLAHILHYSFKKEGNEGVTIPNEGKEYKCLTGDY